MLGLPNNILTVMALVLLLSACSDKEDKYVKVGTVSGIGSCGGNEGFFSGPYECATKVKIDGAVEYWKVYGKVMVGQSVYKGCWSDSKGNWCNATAETRVPYGFSL